MIFFLFQCIKTFLHQRRWQSPVPSVVMKPHNNVKPSTSGKLSPFALKTLWHYFLCNLNSLYRRISVSQKYEGVQWLSPPKSSSLEQKRPLQLSSRQARTCLCAQIPTCSCLQILPSTQASFREEAPAYIQQNGNSLKTGQENQGLAEPHKG